VSHGWGRAARAAVPTTCWPTRPTPRAPTGPICADAGSDTRLKQFRAVATRFDKRGYLFTGTITIAVLLIRLRT